MRKIDLLLLPCALAWLAVPAAHAQIAGKVQVDIPFTFYVQETRLPAGTYILRGLADTLDLVIEIRSADDKTAVLAGVEETEAKSTPEKPELIFNRYGKNEFLSEVFDVGTREGDKLVVTREELKIQKSGMKPNPHSILARK